MSDTNSTNTLMLERAKAAVLSRDYSLATRLYRTLLQSDPDNSDLLFALGDLYQKSGNDSKAIPLYQQLIEKNPKDVVSMNFLGSIYRRIKQWDDSINILEKAVIVDESNMQTFYNLGFTYKLMGRNMEAIQCFNTVVDANPNDVLAYNHIGSIYASEGEHEKAVSAYQRGLKIDPNHPILHLNVAHSYEKLGNDEQACKEYESALRSKPGWLDAIDGYADLLLKKKDIKSVSEMLTQAIRLNPQVASVHSKMGNVWGLQGDYTAAESEYNTALKIEPKNYNTLASLAETYFKNGKTMDAVRTMKKGDDLCADSDKSFMFRYADLMLSADKLNAAGHKIKMLWEKDSEDLRTLNLLAQYYICRGEDAKVEGCLQKIKQLDPTYLDYMVDGAVRYNQMGRYGKAEQNLKKYLQINPNDQKAILVLATCLEKQERYEEAIEEYQKLAASDLDNIFYRTSMERLAQALESQQEDYNFGAEDAYDDENRYAEDDLESTLRGTNGDDSESYDSNAIMSNLDFNNMDSRMMSQAEMISNKNRGYSFENLTMEDHSMDSPFSPGVDEEIMASNSVDDFDNLVPEQEKLPPENHEYLRSLPSDGTGMGSGPVEGLMGDKFLEEDIDGNKKVESRTLNVSDGWDESDDELNAPAPEAKPNYGGGNGGAANSKIDSNGEISGAEGSGGFEEGSGNGFGGGGNGFNFDMEEEPEEINSDEPSSAIDSEIESSEVESDELSIEGDDEIFDSDEDNLSDEGMEFSDEEVSNEEEFSVDQVDDGMAEESEEETDNGYGFSFEDEENSEEQVFTDEEPEVKEPESSEIASEDFVFDAETTEEPETIQSEAEIETTDEEIPFATEPEVDENINVEVDPDAEVETDVNMEIEVDADAKIEADADMEIDVAGDEEINAELDSDDETEPEKNSDEDDSQEDEFEEPEISVSLEDELKLSAELFIKLRDLSAYLPVDKKKEFLESHENLQLEYLIKKLSGEAGLLETAHDIRERLNISDSDVIGLNTNQAKGVLSYMKNYISSLPDQNIARSLEGEVDSAIEKL